MKNSFSISGVRYSGDNVMIFVVIMLVFMLLCLIFIRKDKEYRYSTFDKIGIALNFVIGFVSLPFITLVCVLSEIVGSSTGFLDQMTFTIPSFAMLCLALSIVFRRKGFSKTGFFIQFAGILLFVMLILSDLI